MSVLIGVAVSHIKLAEKLLMFWLPSILAAILVAILNFSKCSSMWTCYTADMFYMPYKEMKYTEKKILQ